jgi:hypothetical protein
MTVYSATIDIKGKAGRIGQQLTASGTYTLVGGITGHASTGDTILFENIIPRGGAKVVAVQVVSPELDTNASPTGTFIVGNSDDDNGFVITENCGLPVVAPANGKQLSVTGTGALIGTAVTNRDIIVEYTAALATSATSGAIRLNVILEGTSA